MIESSSGIYVIKNKITGDTYIGSSINIKKRINSHKAKLRSNKHHNIILQNSYNKYGLSSFDFQVICYCNRELNLILEQEYINATNPYFNIAKNTTAPMLGRKHSEESKVKFKKRKVLKGKDHPCYGTKWDEHYKKRWIKKRTGEKRSNGFREKVSENNIINNSAKYLKKYTEERKEPVIDNEGNEFMSLVEAAYFYKVKVATVCDVLKGRSKSIKRKYTLWYKKDKHLHERFILYCLRGIARNYNKFSVSVNRKLVGHVDCLEKAIILYNIESYKIYKDINKQIDINIFYKYREFIESKRCLNYIKIPIDNYST